MPGRPETPRRVVRRPRTFPVYAATAAMFAALFGFLGVRVAEGQDPSLGAGFPVAAAPVHRVVVRKVVVTRRIVVIKKDRAQAPAAGSGGAAATPVASSSQSYSAPAPVAAAPAPAPVQTASS